MLSINLAFDCVIPIRWFIAIKKMSCSRIMSWQTVLFSIIPGRGMLI